MHYSPPNNPHEQQLEDPPISHIIQMYNWVGVVDFLQKHFESNDLEKKEWLLEKQLLVKKVAELESQMAAGEVINIDLMKRVKILEQCLVQQRRGRETESVNIGVKIGAVIDENERVVKRNDEHLSFLEKILAESGIARTTIRNSLEEDPKPPLSNVLVHSLQGHLDEVRGLFFESKSKSIVSVSEDCLIKVWDSRQLNNKKQIIEPSVTIRECIGQLFAITGTGEDDANSLIFAGGVEGIIKVWDVSEVGVKSENSLKGAWLNFKTREEIEAEREKERLKEQEREREKDKGRRKKEVKKEKVEESFQEDTEKIIWDLAYSHNRLLSSSSSTEIRLYTLDYEYKNSAIASVNPSSLNTFTSEHSSSNPTSLCWMTQNSFINGYASANIITKWNIQTLSVTDLLNFRAGTRHQPLTTQCNKILYNQSLNTIVSGHQDGVVRCFDPNTNRLVKSLEHKDSVSCMVIPKDTSWELFTATHSGVITLWDIRTSQVLKEITNTHLKKFDECIQSLSLMEQKRMLVSGGADGTIKIYQY